jgi:hypothetical protein
MWRREALDLIRGQLGLEGSNLSPDCLLLALVFELFIGGRVHDDLECKAPVVYIKCRQI